MIYNKIHLRFTFQLLIHLHLISTNHPTAVGEERSVGWPSDLLPDLLLSHICLSSPPPTATFTALEFPVMSSVPSPHSKHLIPSEHDCYYGNCSNKNKHPLADLDFSEIHKFVNKRRNSGVSETSLSAQQRLLVTIQKRWRRLTWREKLISHYAIFPLKIHETLAVWKHPVGPFWWNNADFPLPQLYLQLPSDKICCPVQLCGTEAKSRSISPLRHSMPLALLSPSLGCLFFYFNLMLAPLASSAADWPGLHQSVGKSD